MDNEWEYDAAETAASNFRKRAKGVDPDEIPEVGVSLPGDGPTRSTTAPHLIVALGFGTSTSGARRKIDEGAVTIGPDRSAVTDPRVPIEVADGLIVRVGKHKIARVRLQ